MKSPKKRTKKTSSTNSQKSNSRSSTPKKYLKPPKKWIDSIKEIHNVRRSEQLVVFVGSGVSCNSGLLTWSELIKKMIEKLEIPQLPQNLEYASTEVYLTIAQYYYNKYGKKEYFNIIRDTVGVDVKPNPIDDVIFELAPRHVVTTNWDRLLEASANKSQPKSSYQGAPQYKPIINDYDFVNSSNPLGASFPRYIIKMHGDVKNEETIILKEEDYLHYELSHPLMCSYLKALLADNSFLFVGYSLEDYNLKQIIEWINYETKEVAIKDRRRHYIVVNSKEISTTKEQLNKQKLDQRRLKKYGIQVVNLDGISSESLEIPDDEKTDQYRKFFCDKTSDSASQELGKKLYLCLYHLCDYDKFMIRFCVQDYIYEKVQLLKTYKKISVQDVLASLVFHQVGFSLTSKIDNRRLRVSLTLHSNSNVSDIQHNYQHNYLVQIREYLDKIDGKKNEDSRNSDFFRMANIDEIKIDGKEFSYAYLNSDDTDELFNLYLDNNYKALKDKLEKYEPSEEALFYRLLLDFLTNFDNKNDSYFGKGKDEGITNIPQSRISSIQQKLRNLFIQIRWYELSKKSSRDKQVVAKEGITLSQYLNSIDANLINVVERYYGDVVPENLLLRKTDKTDKEDFDSITLKTFFYDFYFFIFKNHLPLLDYEGLSKYFEPFIKSILSPDNMDNYNINEIDLDILIKYTDTDKLDYILSTQNVLENRLKFTEKPEKLIQKLENLCLYLPYSSTKLWWGFLIRFIMILSYVDQNQFKTQVDKINNSILKMLQEVDQESCLQDRETLKEKLSKFYEQNKIEFKTVQDIFNLLRRRSPIPNSETQNFRLYDDLFAKPTPFK